MSADRSSRVAVDVSKRADSLDSASHTLLLGSLFAIATALFAWRWVGLLGSDDASYYYAAKDWVLNFPSVAKDAFAMRFPVVLPLAALISIVGSHEWTLAAVSIAHFMFTVTLTY